LLPLLRATAEQDHKAVAVLAEVDAESRAEVDLAFKDAGTDALVLEKFPRSIYALAQWLPWLRLRHRALRAIERIVCSRLRQPFPWIATIPYIWFLNPRRRE
jgi:PleD family two-component response regulator